MLGQAQTGTGKTAAFALPVLARIDVKNPAVQALVLAPTRELAIQVAEAFQSYAAHLKNFHVLPIYGGQSYTPQLAALKRGVWPVAGCDEAGRGPLAGPVVAAAVVLQHWDMLVPEFRVIIHEREQLREGLERIPGVTVFPSQANFLLARIEAGAARVWEALGTHGILVRHFPGSPALQDCLRITVGTPDENAFFAEALASVRATTQEPSSCSSRRTPTIRPRSRGHPARRTRSH